MLPYIGLYHVENDNQLDHVGSLLGDDITSDNLIQTLILAEDMHDQFLLTRNVQKEPESDHTPDFTIRKEDDPLNIAKPTSLSFNQRMTDAVPKPIPDDFDNINDPDEEEKDDPIENKNVRVPLEYMQPLSLKEQQRMEYEEAKLLDLQRIQKFDEEQKEKQQLLEQKEKEDENIQLKIAESLSKLAEEPSEGNPDAATILIRLADGKSVTRRFLKTLPVEQLYLYIQSKKLFISLFSLIVNRSW